MVRKSGWCGIAAAVLSLAAAGWATAGVAVIDQSRELATKTQNGVKTKTATPSAPFDDSLSDVFDSTTGRHEQAFAQQTSSVSLTSQSLHVLANGGVNFNSRQRGNPPASTDVSADSKYSFTFTLDSAATYSLNETQQGSNPSSGAVFQGSRLESNGALVPNWFFLGSSPDPNHVSLTGTLAPGTYVYSGAAHGNGDFDEGNVTFTTDFTVSAAVSAVPLPASLWMFLTVLPIAGVVMLRMKRIALR